MKFISHPKLIRQIFKKIVWKSNTNEKIIYLTFDDCSNPEVLDFVLDILKKYEIKATFFCSGKYIVGTNIISKIKSSGHNIGNHGYNHLNGWKSSNKKYINDIFECSKVIDSKLFRPPYGKLSLKQYFILRKYFKIILWDVMSYDFDKNTSPKQCFDYVTKNATKGSIIVFHANSKAENNIITCLPDIIDFYVSKGYSFGVLY